MLVIILVCTAIIAVCLYLIIWPFFTVKHAAAAAGSDSLDIESVYEAVNELEMDALMNKISDEDFNGLKDSYYRIAAEVIEKKTKADQDILAALEEIRSAKKQAEQ
ncbi:hypothetical protein A8F94_06180 [Bacillus sp. FJAT-27225]|uniref:hypothetical protein n=1 Tax=Bacillus sp. FJAT-27225 TaxID=1743144 RepID=UPI00080C248D|nr:hypothetical protein [Bacillus sp. FJAT-27225]OCA91439.1 hypothetical protein A8F94_06180 [Bacillus sp. FJAT-27225]